jgi:hypothetical protein
MIRLPNPLFSDVLERFKPGPSENGEHLCGEKRTGGGRRLYADDPLLPGAFGEKAEARWKKKYEIGASIVFDSMANDYTEAVAKAALNAACRTTGRPLNKEVTRGDLNVLHYELLKQQQKLQGVGGTTVAERGVR